MKKIVLISILTLMCSTVFSQATNEVPVAHTPSTLKEADKLPLEGTYQIIAVSEFAIVAISNEILYQIEREREIENDTYIVVRKGVKIKILSTNLINSNDFVPLKKIRYED